VSALSLLTDRPRSLSAIELACDWAARRCAFTRRASAALSRHTSAKSDRKSNPIDPSHKAQ
jgi:hypothetical protein